MADFCKQCSLNILGHDYGDLKNLGQGRKLEDGQGWLALCEGCGMIIVDDEGECIDYNCPVHGPQMGQVVVIR